MLDATMYRCHPKDLGSLSEDEKKALAATVRHAWELLLSLFKNPKSEGGVGGGGEEKTVDGPKAPGFDPQKELFEEHSAHIREVVAASLVCPIEAVRVALCDGMRNFCLGFSAQSTKANVGACFRDELLLLLPYTSSKTRHCAEYFQLVAELFAASFEHGRFDFAQFSLPAQSSGKGPPRMFNILEQLEYLLKRHDCGGDGDQTLYGLLNLIKVVVQLMATSAGAKGSRELLDKSAPRLIEEIYKCLFAARVDLTQNDKCGSARCRDAAFKAISELSASSPKAFSTQLELTRDAHLNMPAHKVSRSLSLIPFISLCFLCALKFLVSHIRFPAARVGDRS
jgi:hypothetical protein